MDETQLVSATMYWCHMCNRSVEPVIEMETIQCPLCQSGFIEQMEPTTLTSRENRQISDDTFSLWAPVLLGLMSNPRRRRRFRRRQEFEYEDNDDILSSIDEGEPGLDHELQSFIRTRRRNSATILQFLQGIRAGENDNGVPELETTETRDRNRVILINQLNQTIVLQGGNFRNRNHNQLDLLLQHLSENDPNRYGTPPAQKEAVEAMPTVKITENLQCSICLDDLELGIEAKEMPCKHKFHSGCILPWLAVHSSCPVCRYELPSDGCKIDNNNIINNISNGNITSSSSSSGLNNGDSNNDEVNNVEGRNERGENRRWYAWPFSNLFSSGTRGSSSSSSTNSTRNASSPNEN